MSTALPTEQKHSTKMQVSNKAVTPMALLPMLKVNGQEIKINALINRQSIEQRENSLKG